MNFLAILINFYVLISRMRMSPQVFAEATVLGKRYTGQEAKDAGIVQAISPQRDLIETAVKVGKSIIPKNGFNRKYLQNSKINVYGLKIRPLRNTQGLMKSFL